MSTSKALAAEMKTYDRLLPELIAQEGKFALIAGDKLTGVYDTYGDALSEGYKAVGLGSFLVKKITPVEVAAFVARDFDPECTSQRL